MVLTHLILNDMVKVKGQISEMATCLEDKDSRISDLAKLFFLELSKKVRQSVSLGYKVIVANSLAMRLFKLYGIMFVYPVKRLKRHLFLLQQYATVCNEQCFLAGIRNLELRVFQLD